MRRGMVVAALVLLDAAPSAAEQAFYDALAAQTGTCADCRLCHTGPVGNKDTWDVSKPFTLYMLANNRLGSVPAPEQDSDGDTFTDLQELQENGDPNDPLVGPGQFECPTGPLPEYGCVARVSPNPLHRDGWALALSFLPALLLFRRRRTLIRRRAQN